MRTILWNILYVLINIAHELNPTEYETAKELIALEWEGLLAPLAVIAIIGDLVNFFSNLESKK